MQKNIVIVVSAMNMGGAQRVVSILSDYWCRNGHHVTLICTFTGEKTSHFGINKNVTLEYLNNSPFSPDNKIWNLFWKLFHLRKVVNQQNPDVVISFLTRVNVATTLATLGMKSSLIICERTWPPFAALRGSFLWPYRFLFRSVDKIVVQTEKSKDWLSENFPKSVVKVIPNLLTYPLPFHTPIVSPDSVISSDRKIIIASGRLHKYKQFDLLIKAFLQIKDKYLDWDLIILGSGEEKEFLDSMLVDLGMVDRVYFPGRVGNISEWYERADLFVLSSIVEGFPNVLLEAMGYGLPCVSFDCDTGPRDMIQNGVNGILVNPSEGYLGLCRAIDEVIGNKELREYIAKNAILSRDTYSVDHIVKKWSRVLDV